MPTDAGTLRIRRLDLRSRVVGGASPLELRPEALGAALVDRLSAAASGGDPSVWLIRTLDVRMSVDTSWTRGRTADAAATAVVAALARRLDRGPDGEDVQWFPDRATFLARFLVDLADGRSRGRWEYREFEDLAPTTSGAVRSVIEWEPRVASDALRLIAPADTRRIMARLTPRDAEGVLGALASLSVGRVEDPAHAVAEALDVLLARGDLPADPRRAALALFVEVAHQRDAPVGTDAHARDAAGLAEKMRAAGPADARRLADALARADWGAVDAPTRRRLAGLATWPAEARARAVRSLVGDAPPGSRSAGALLETELGGMFLLLPLLNEFPWAPVTAAWPAIEDVPPSRVLHYLTLIAALGAERTPIALADPVLRLALGISDVVDARSLSTWAHDLGRRRIGAALRGLVGQLHGAGKVSGDVTLAPLRGGVVAVDGGRGIWLGTAPAEPSAIRDLVAGIDSAIGRPAAVAATDAWIEACLEPGSPRSVPIGDRMLIRLEDEARLATIGGPLDLPPALRDMAMVTAHALLRELAWRLPGFSASTLPYLRDNFLSFAAEVRPEPDRFVVEVGDPPLHLVLSLTGLNRRHFHLDATGDRRWVLTQRR